MRRLVLLFVAAGCMPKGDAVTEVRLRTDAPPVADARLETATFALG